MVNLPPSVMTISGFLSYTPFLVMRTNNIKHIDVGCGQPTGSCFYCMRVKLPIILIHPVKKILIWPSLNRFSRPSRQLHFVSMAVVMKSRGPFQTQGEKIIWMPIIEEHCGRTANPTVHFLQKSRVKNHSDRIHSGCVRGFNGV